MSPAEVAAQGAPTSSSAPGSYLARLDWRFLLAHPSPARVGWIGVNQGLLDQLRSVAEVDVLPQDGGQSFMVVVASEPTDRELGLAARCVAPGGSLVVEVNRPPARRAVSTGRRMTTLAAVARRVRELGLNEVRTHWHWPDLDRCTRIVPLDEGGPVRHVLSGASAGLRARLQSWGARLLVDLGMLDRMVCGIVIARSHAESLSSRVAESAAGDPAGAAYSVVHRFFRDRIGSPDAHARGIGARAPFLVLTPRFRNSSHLVFLLFEDGRATPAVAVKFARRPGSSPALEDEARQLRAIQSLAERGFDSIPRVIACESFEGHGLLAETALAGQGMDPARVRADTDGCCAAVVNWLLEVQAPSRRATAAGDAWLARRIERDLDVLESAGVADASVAAATRKALAPLASHPIPRVLEHGDLGHPNLLLTPAGTVGVLDWELADLEGLPAADLFFFLGYVARARQRMTSGPGAARAVLDAFAHGPDWLRRALDRYAAGLSIPGTALGPLFVACWMAQSAGLVRRMPAQAAGAAGLGAELRDDWRVRIWRQIAAEPDRFLRGA